MFVFYFIGRAKELNWYFIHNFRFMSDQEAWHELCNLYMAEGEFAKAAFCMEELLLHNPHSHLYHQRLAEIRYTMVCQDYLQSNSIFSHSNRALKKNRFMQ